MVPKIKPLKDITHVAQREEEFAHQIRDVSKRFANISDKHMELGKQIRKLDALLQKDRHKIKVYGVPEIIQDSEEFIEESEDDLVDTLIDIFNEKLNVPLRGRDIEEAIRVGFWPRELPRAVKISLANHDLKEKLMHESKKQMIKGLGWFQMVFCDLK